MTVDIKGWTDLDRRVWSFVLFFGASFLYATRAILPISIAMISHENDWNKSTSGAILSSFFWGYAITQLFAGSLADRLGGERLLFASSIVWIVLTILTPFIFDLSQWTGSPLPFLIILRVITGVSQGFFMPSMASICSRNLCSLDKSRTFGLCLGGTHVGVVIAGAIGTSILNSYGWRTLFHFMGAISLVWLFIFHSVMSSSLEKKKKSSIHLPLLLSSEKALEVPWGTLLKHPSFWAAGIAHYTGTNAYFMIFNWAPTFFQDVYPDADGQLYNVLPAIAIVITSISAPFISSFIHSQGISLTRTRKIVEIGSLVVVAILLTLISPLASFPSTLITIILAMAGKGLSNGGVCVNPHDFAPNHTGAVFGIFNSFGAITGFIGVFVAGHILESTYNDWTAVFQLTAAQCLLGAIVYGALGTAQPII